MCWLINHTQADHRQRTEDVEDINEEEYQYHAGMHNGIESIRDMIEVYDVDVEARAERFAEESDQDIYTTPEREE